ncbi:MAG: hypothetical protein R3F56_18710 [Planctomycetota bacterium]
MTDATVPSIPELDSLEPLTDEAAMVLEAAPGASTKTGLPPIFYRADAHGEYYRFLFGGLIMTLGCFMPFGADMVPGYQTLAGAFYLVLSLCLVWTMWIAIHSGRFRMKWIMFALVPFLILLLDCIFVGRNVGIAMFKATNPMAPIAESWLDAIKAGMSGSADEVPKGSNFLRAFGTGRVVVFIGSLLNFVSLVSAVFGGAKHAKAQKAAVRAAAAERRGR